MLMVERMFDIGKMFILETRILSENLNRDLL